MLSKLNPFLPAPQDFHRPASWVGKDLRVWEKQEFDSLLMKIKSFMTTPAHSFTCDALITIIDHVFKWISMGPPYSDKVLGELVRFLRVSLMSLSQQRVMNTVIVCDVLVKNCGTSIHSLIGKRYFMKTIALVARRQFHKRSTKSRDLSLFILDTIQAWGEAFSTLALKHEYPHYYRVYLELRTTYGMPFGPPFDPRRVPIFLGPMLTLPENWNYCFDCDRMESLAEAQVRANFEAASPDLGGDIDPTYFSSDEAEERHREADKNSNAVDNLDILLFVMDYNVKMEALNSSTAPQRISRLMSPTRVLTPEERPFIPSPAVDPFSPECYRWTDTVAWEQLPVSSPQPVSPPFVGAPFSNNHPLDGREHQDVVVGQSIISHEEIDTTSITQQAEATGLSIHYFGSQRIVRRH